MTVGLSGLKKKPSKEKKQRWTGSPQKAEQLEEGLTFWALSLTAPHLQASQAVPA